MGIEREGPTFSVNSFNLFEDSHRALGENWASRVVHGVRKKDGCYTRHRNTKEHENLVLRMCVQDTKVAYDGATYLMKKTNMLESKAGREK